MIEYRISSYCTAGGCVEVGHSPSEGAVIVRDSKDPSRSVSIRVPERAWSTFLAGVRQGDFSAE